MGNSDDKIGASNEDVRELLTRCGRILGVEYVPYTPPPLSENAKMLKELRESMSTNSQKNELSSRKNSEREHL